MKTNYLNDVGKVNNPISIARTVKLKKIKKKSKMKTHL